MQNNTKFYNNQGDCEVHIGFKNTSEIMARSTIGRVKRHVLTEKIGNFNLHSQGAVPELHLVTL